MSYPLLSDAGSKTIRDFGIFNHNIAEDHEWYGICFPGTYIVDARGIVKSKHFEPMHRQRLTTDTVLVKEFGVGGGKRVEIETSHLKLVAFPSQDEVRPGNRIALVLEVELPPGMHVYAPGVEGYRPVTLTLDEHPALLVHAPEFSEARKLHLKAIGETVPVFEGRARILQEVTISPFYQEPRLEVAATFSYQACDERVCYAPAKVPLTFHLTLAEHDRERAPEALRKRGISGNR